MKIREIENTGITGNKIRGNTQTVISLINNNEYKVIIHSEENDDKSYCRLYGEDRDRGFSNILQRHPKFDYNISFTEDIEGAAFSSIVDDLFNVAVGIETKLMS